MCVLFSLKYEICQQNSGVTESLFGVCVCAKGGGGGGGGGGGWADLHLGEDAQSKVKWGGGHWGAQGVNGGPCLPPRPPIFTPLQQKRA